MSLSLQDISLLIQEEDENPSEQDKIGSKHKSVYRTQNYENAYTWIDDDTGTNTTKERFKDSDTSGNKLKKGKEVIERHIASTLHSLLSKEKKEKKSPKRDKYVGFNRVENIFQDMPAYIDDDMPGNVYYEIPSDSFKEV